jgi:SAM-dependent methyltransferase
MNFEWARDLNDEQWAAALAGGDHRAPAPPPPEIQSMFVGSSGVSAYDECKVFWRLTRNYLNSAGSAFNASTRILDLGVGWGRNYRWLLRDIHPKNIVGIDVDPKTIELCKRSMPYGQFLHVPPGGPYPTEGAQFDLAVAYSVFSHLSEDTAKSVLRLARAAMRPGALFALTTLRPAHIEVWAKQTESPFYGDLLAAIRFDRFEWWERASEGQHLYLQTGGGDPTRPADSYGEAVVPKGWWERVEDFRLVSYERPIGLPQSYIVLRAV